MTSTNCQICGKQLKDDESIARGVGPDCVGKRTTFYTSCGTTEAEIAHLEAAGAGSARWIRNFRQDMRNGRVRQAKQCIELARYQAAKVAPVVAPAKMEQEAEPVIVVRQVERGGFYVHTPFKLEGFVSAFKAVVGGSWHPEKEEWYVPASQLSWTVGALEYWFGLKVRVQSNELRT